tara:strand:- start:27823 stop:28593 length:771 start_codon:yes stop_codon:yes gene_type:complete
MDYNGKIIYVADIEEDIDDMVAAEFLHVTPRGYLDGVVLDRDTKDSKRVKELLDMGVKFFDEIPEGTSTIYCGGAVTKIAKYLENNELKLLVINGGFAGTNLVKPEDELGKFRGKKYVRTYNFNCDVDSALAVLNSPNVEQIYLVSKNVCHDKRNTTGNVHYNKENKTNNSGKHIHFGTFLQKYNLSPTKCLHDLLMVKEAVTLRSGEPENLLCEYMPVRCIHRNERVYGNSNKHYDVWGSVYDESSHIKISVKLK